MIKERTSSYEILVDSHFCPDIEKEMKRATSTEYPGYPFPKDRLKLSLENLYKWKACGARTSDLPKGDWIIQNHRNYIKGMLSGCSQIDKGQDFSNYDFDPSFDAKSYKRDERGIPIRPYDELFLLNGAVGGFGFYRHYGPNRCADPIVFCEYEGNLQVLMIARGDSGFTALPGGMSETDNPKTDATRELLEETGVDLQDTTSKVIHQGIVWSDTRSTRNAWAETSVILFLPDKSLIEKAKPKAGDDAKEARWVGVCEKTFNNPMFFASHASFVKLAVLAWQKENNKLVLKDGKII